MNFRPINKIVADIAPTPPASVAGLKPLLDLNTAPVANPVYLN